MTSRRFVGLLPLAAFSLLLASGCDAPGVSRKAKAPVAPPQQGIGQATTTGAPFPGDVRSMGPAVETVGLSVSNAIAKACGIAPTGDGKAVAPNFEFDSAALAPDDRVLLAKVARCLSEGALRGRNVMLIGRADPRGENEYNMMLGGSRADTVHRYMVDLGVGRERMHTTSRGEMDATGKDEAGWAHDRRVDVELAN